MQVSFGGHYRPITSRITTDFYTGLFVDRDRRSVEHLVPRSKGGRDEVQNYVMVDAELNRQRDNMSLHQWLKLHPNYIRNMKRYVIKYWNILFNGNPHGESVAQTVKRAYGIDLLGS